MRKGFAFVLGIVVMLMIVQAAAAQSAASEDEKTRPNKEDVLAWMAKAAQVPAAQQNTRLDSILQQDAAAGATPRSDFLFCIGLAYSGNRKAQRCVGKSYEHGRGIVEDLSEAYAWYSIALENKSAAQADEAAIEADRERVKERLLSAYPHPTEDELDDMVKAQKTLIAQYQADAAQRK